MSLCEKSSTLSFMVAARAPSASPSARKAARFDESGSTAESVRCEKVSLSRRQSARAETASLRGSSHARTPENMDVSRRACAAAANSDGDIPTQKERSSTCRGRVATRTEENEQELARVVVVVVVAEVGE
eukprot:1340273-Pleurochrysis_carterae.AAC.1